MYIKEWVNEFIDVAISFDSWMEMDRIYLQNRIETILAVDLNEAVPNHLAKQPDKLTQLLQLLPANLTSEDKGRIESELGDLLTPPPSVVNALFAKTYEVDPKQATDYLYDLSKSNHSVSNHSFSEKELCQYPFIKEKCVACYQQEGKLTNNFSLAKRFIRMNLANESWMLQYLSFPQLLKEGLVSYEEHQLLPVNQQTVQRLFQLATILPQFTWVYRSQLEEELQHSCYHFARYTYPVLTDTSSKKSQSLLFSDVQVEKLLSYQGVSLSSTNQKSLEQASYFILEQWKQQQPTESIQLILRKQKEVYQLVVTFQSASRLANNQNLGMSDSSMTQEEKALTETWVEKVITFL